MILRKKDGKITTNFEPTEDSDVKNKAHLNENFLKINGYLSIFEKVYNEFILQYDKQCVEQSLIQRAVKTTLQILYDKGVFDFFQNTGKVPKDFLLTTRSRPDLEEVNDDIQ